MFKSLRSRLSIIFVSLAIVPVLVVSSIVALRSFNTLEAESLISEQETARYASSQINAFLQERQNELQLLTEVEGLENLSPEAQEQLLNNLLSYSQVYYELTLLDGSGQELMRLSRRTSFAVGNGRNGSMSGITSCAAGSSRSAASRYLLSWL